MRLLMALPLFALLAACASGPGHSRRYERLLTPVAQPTEVIATEIAFARTAQEDGQWSAFRDYSTDDAVMFVPQPVNAHDWLGGRENPAQSVQWQAHHVWSSCDGTLAVTKGAWQRPDGTFGYFTTVWQRQRDGEYKWVMDQGDVLAEPLPAPDFVRTTVADCGDEIIVSAVHDPVTAMGSGGGFSDDSTLSYHWVVFHNGHRSVRVTAILDGKAETVLDLSVSGMQE